MKRRTAKDETPAGVPVNGNFQGPRRRYAYETVTLEQLKHVLLIAITDEMAEHVPPGSVRVDLLALTSFVRNVVRVRVTTALFGNTLEQVTVKYPANWWEAVKERWLRWLPSVRVRYETVTLTARELYPRLSLPDEEGHVALEKSKRTTYK
jgi:hypothetical protein